ncbi:aspartate kinase [Caminicella sporogenes DSM 14501]|uniref:Aspartokinase n=1 Tax=Caminicella sporogenes DSM 14501 TaxID=1121266 RepID=A0A1M6L788_9FIRM|nr:aspartate kinase [Caminicella sporogenes]RKD27731.1 aspartate kinase [Caminicella sporogenes]SHJ67047.1 aspartate kinase [Caminicella sporogenes DSM 14501]
MNIVVQKFGGTSVASQELRDKIADKIIETKLSGKKPVVVVSAIGRKGDSYATDTLINFANSIFSERCSRELDLIMSCGEIISSVIMANTIKSKGYDAVAMTGFQAGIITDENFGNACVKRVDPKNIIENLKEDKIVVVTGFQGITENGDITTLGRGGSDTTAVILGEALKADVVEIYTDVDGVMTADPRLVPDANVIDCLSYDEVYQMATDGAKVIHPKAVEIAERSNITLKIKNTFTDSDGTTIKKSEYTFSNICSKTLFTAIAYKNDIVQVNIEIDSDDEKNKLLLDGLEKNKISIDMINFFEERKVFTIEEKDLTILKSILDFYNLKYKLTTNCSKVTAIGHRIHGVPGVMAKIVKILSNENIKILQTSDSNTTISCLITRDNLEKAVRALHYELLNK